MGKKLSSAPLYYTVVQVQFSPVLDLEGYIPSIQSKMRDAHFPDYQREISQNFVLPFNGTEQGSVVAPTVAQQTRYRFGDISGRSLFILETNSLSFITTNYDTYEAFSDPFLKGLGMLNDVLRLDFVARIGLRYLDAVQPGEGEALRDFLVPEVLGITSRIDGTLQHSLSESVLSTGSVQLISRVVIRDGHIGLPVELAASAPTIDPRFTQRAGKHAIIDNDAFISQRQAFDLGKVKEQLMRLHEEAGKAFKATVTDHAWASWA